MTFDPSSTSLIDRARALFQGILGRSRGDVTGAPRVDTGAFARYARFYTEQVNRLADQLAASDITVQQWLAQMTIEVERLHTTAYVVGAGGLSEITQEDMQKIASINAQQRGFLTGWAQQLAGEDEISAAKIKQRAQLYLNAANATLQKATTAAMGMPQLPAYPGDGTTECLVNCKCTWWIKRMPGRGNWDCTWKLAPAEHCDTCNARAVAWSPLQIRSGQIQAYASVGLFRQR